MNEIEQLLQRQARWQKSRKALSWPEKIRMAERVRESAERWCSKAGKRAARSIDATAGAGDGPSRATRAGLGGNT